MRPKKLKIRFLRLTAICLLIVLVHPVLGQNRIEAIKQKIKNAPTDSLQAEAYLDLGYEFLFHNLDNSLDQAMDAATTAAQIAQEKNVPVTRIAALNLMARIYREQGKRQKAISSYLEAIEVCQSIQAKTKEHQIKDNLSNSYYEMGKKAKALDLKIKAYKHFIETKDTTSALVTRFGIAWIYQNEQQLEKAKKMFLEIVKLAKGHEDRKPTLIETVGNLGIIYEKLNQLDSAIYYMEWARIIGKDYVTFILDNDVALADVFLKQNKTDKALATLKRVHKEYSANASESMYQTVKLSIAKILLNRNKAAEAKKYLNDVDTSIVNHSFQQLKEYGHNNFRFFMNQKDYKRALDYYTIFRNANDSLNDARRDSSFKKIEEKYQSEVKQTQINRQKLKIRNYSLGLGGALALLLIGSIAFYGYRRKMYLEKKLAEEKTEKQLIEIEKLKQEVKIISMQSMIEGQEEERKRIARDLHDNIGTLMTSIKMKVLAIQREVQSLEKMNIANELDTMIDNASQQVRRISYSMTPIALDISGLAPAIKDLGQQLVEQGITLNAQLDGLKNITDKKISINVYRILQELIQNILKHSEASEVSLNLSEKDNTLIIRVRDNGIGLDKEVWENTKSIGVNNIKSRVNYLNGDIKLIVDSGTHFKIGIPLKQS